jgi:hypothetical protein
VNALGCTGALALAVHRLNRQPPQSAEAADRGPPGPGPVDAAGHGPQNDHTSERSRPEARHTIGAEDWGMFPKKGIVGCGLRAAGCVCCVCVCRVSCVERGATEDIQQQATTHEARSNRN